MIFNWKSIWKILFLIVFIWVWPTPWKIFRPLIRHPRHRRSTSWVFPSTSLRSSLLRDRYLSIRAPACLKHTVPWYQSSLTYHYWWLVRSWELSSRLLKERWERNYLQVLMWSLIMHFHLISPGRFPWRWEGNSPCITLGARMSSESGLMNVLVTSLAEIDVLPHPRMQFTTNL